MFFFTGKPLVYSKSLFPFDGPIETTNKSLIDAAFQTGFQAIKTTNTLTWKVDLGGIFNNINVTIFLWMKDIDHFLYCNPHIAFLEDENDYLDVISYVDRQFVTKSEWRRRGRKLVSLQIFSTKRARFLQLWLNRNDVLIHLQEITVTGSKLCKNL